MAISGMRLTGVESCLAKLTALPLKIQKQMVRKAIRAGGNPFVKAARAGAPVRNRLLKSSLTQVIRVYDGTVLAVIGQEKTKRFQKASKKIKHSGGISGRGELTPIHLVEEAVKPHEIVRHETRESGPPKRDRRGRFVTSGVKVESGKPLAIETSGGKIFRRRVKHPGHKGKHFVRKAATQAEPSALSGFERKLVEELMKDA